MKTFSPPTKTCPTHSSSEHCLCHRDSSISQYEDPRQYAFALGDRVTSFEADPLHSTAYLAYLARYLKSPFHTRSRRPQGLSTEHNLPGHVFIHQFILQPSKQPEHLSFNDPSIYFAQPCPLKNEIVFLTGRPSAEWLNAVGAKYKLDHRFFHQHLGPILASHKHWYAVPTLPSRSIEVLRLCLPSIIFIGSQGRDVDVLGLELARNDCNEQLRRSFQSIQDSSASEAGHSIIRRMQIHIGSTLAIEQEMTITLVERGQNWTVLIWTDAGGEMDHSYIPVPSTDGFTAVSSQLTFCPIFFESELIEKPVGITSTSNLTRQPLALLSANYGITIDWTKYREPSPLSMLQEILAFEAASALQYINMIERVLSDHMSRGKFPSYEHSTLETVLHFDYAKAVLARSELHFAEVLSFLENPPLRWTSKTATAASVDEFRAISALKGDFGYLVSRVERLLSICDAGKATLISNASVQEGKRSAEEARLVTELTKATNRVTFIFLPISYVTAVFGMNFSQFGQGTLSIWLWAVITLPLLIVSVLVVEYGRWIKERFRRDK